VTAAQVQITNSGNMAVNLTQLTVTDLGPGNASDITSVIALINGTQVGVPTAFVGNTATINLNNYVLSAGPAQTVKILANFSGTSNGTYQLSMNLSGTSTNNGGQPANFTGLPVAGNTIVVQQPTFTPTLSPTPTFTITPTVSPTPTSSQTPVPEKNPIIFPNPVDGTVPVKVRPPAFTGTSDVKVQLYTLAFRKVQENVYPNMVAGQDCPIPLKDSWNNPLASGLYYVVVTTHNGRTIGKMLLLR
jgi:hypothetical protein